MARTKLTARKRTIVMPTMRMRFTLGKRVPPHLVEALRNIAEEPQEEPPVEVPIEDSLEDKMVDGPRDEDTKEGPMYEEPMEIEESDEEPMEEDEQGGQDGASDPKDGDASDNSDSDDGGNDGGDHGDGGDDGDDSGHDGDDGSDGDRDGGDGGGDGDDYHAALLAKGWTTKIHYDLQGDAYYHPKLLSLVCHYHTRCTVQYQTKHWTHPDYIGFWETEVYIHKGSQVRYFHHAITTRLTRVATI
ncbi:uncharacterized protein [Miscanthus floridulus]|uniref:uncharacterized protein n=1 Tax=Miscanthus floridulus TaxID=154761 RepID=UPI003458AC8D